MTIEFRNFSFTFPDSSDAVRQITPGITDCGEYVCFAADAPCSDEVKLSLYSPDSTGLLSRIPMKRTAPEGDIFAVLVKKSECLGLTYSYFGANGEIDEPYAYKTVSNSKNKENRSRKKSCVYFPGYNWTDESRPHYAFSEMIIYKLHVKGFSMEDADCKKSDKLLSSAARECMEKENAQGISPRKTVPGTFGALISKIGYLKELGINSVLLMPVYEFDDKNNYWGYGAESDYFCIKRSYASESGSASEEFMETVNSFHRAGIEVMMEMSFGSEKGIMFIDSCLRFYSSVYHIDGFRFMSYVPEFDILTEDPYLRHVKLINYEISEKSAARCSKSRNLAVCSSDFQITVRRFLKADEEQAEAFRDSIKRNPKDYAKINYITDADGFTLNDLYSYDVKNNFANGEDNRDGCGKNYSWNCGAEGPQKTAKIKSLRLSMYKNALAALILSQGTPLLLAGDEHLNSQLGNNNAYCQDNQVSWLDWNTNRQSREIFDFTRKLIAFRKANPVFSGVVEYAGSECVYHGVPKLSFHGIRPWYPDYGSWSRTLGILFNSDGRHYYLVYNMHWEEHEFEIPEITDGTDVCSEAVIIAETGVKKCRAVCGKITVPPRSTILTQIMQKDKNE